MKTDTPEHTLIVCYFDLPRAVVYRGRTATGPTSGASCRLVCGPGSLGLCTPPPPKKMSYQMKIFSHSLIVENLAERSSCNRKFAHLMVNSS